MEQRLVIRSLPQAYEVIKGMDLAYGWEGDYRQSAREALKEILEGRMEERISEHLELMGLQLKADRRNGTYVRHLLTELGDIELEVPRTRRMSAVEVVRAYARRVRQVDRMILSCFVLGLSTRKVAHALLPVLGERVSAGTVSRIAQSLDSAVDAFHRRSIKRRYQFLILDGVILKRKTGGGSARRAVLVALGITAEGKKEVIDFSIAPGESREAWEAFLSDLYRRGLKEKDLEMIVVDGGVGLLAALPVVYPAIPIQRCWAHKTRNVTDKVRKADRETVKKDLHKISHASGIREAQSAIGAFCRSWKDIYPKAVACLLADEEELLSFFKVKDPSLWTHIRTTNAIERKFVEVRRRTRPMGVFSDRTSMERILFAVFTYENFKQGILSPFSLHDTNVLT
jgi:transposase-like protein